MKKLWQCVKPFPQNTGKGQTDRQTDRCQKAELLYQYRASVCWRSIKIIIGLLFISLSFCRAELVRLSYRSMKQNEKSFRHKYKSSTISTNGSDGSWLWCSTSYGIGRKNNNERFLLRRQCTLIVNRENAVDWRNSTPYDKKRKFVLHVGS